MTPTNAATPAPAVSGNGRRLDLLGRPIKSETTTETNTSQRLPSRTTLARRWPGLRINRLNYRWVDDATGAKGDDIESLLAFLNTGGDR